MMQIRLISSLAGAMVASVCAAQSVLASPPSPAMPPNHGVAAVWSQVIGNQVDVKTVSNFQPPKVEMRFVLPGNSRKCDEYWIWYRTTSNGNWIKSATDALERSHDIGKFKVSTSDFPMTLCRVETDPSWFHAGISTSSQKFSSVTVWSPPSSAIGAPLTKPVQTIVAAAGSIGNQNAGADQIVMVTIGDTGCRGLPSGQRGRKHQSCRDQTYNGQYKPNAWFFPELMTKVEKVTLDSGSTAKPDIFLHVGDYRYFWEDYFDGPGGRKHSDDNLGYWLQEFLTPAQKALTIAPWILARGNHETCPYGQWYGHGWYYLFGDVNWPQQRCNELVPTTYFDIGPKGGADIKTRHRMVLFDNSHNGNSLGSRVQDAVNATTNAKGDAHVASTHWGSHVPSVAYFKFCGGQCGYSNDHTLQLLLDTMPKGPVCKFRGSGLPRCVPSTLFAGHQHFFEQIQMTSDAKSTDWVWPQMYTVGHGGTKKDGTGFRHRDFRCGRDLHLPRSKSWTSQNRKRVTVFGNIWADERYGFVVWRRDKSTIPQKAGWVPKPFWIDSARPHRQESCPNW